MPKYMLEVKYTGEAVKGLIKDGGSKRRGYAQSLCEAAGGKLDALYFAFGDVDAYAIADFPDNVTAAAAALSVSASGIVSARTVALLTPEEVDAAAKKAPSYTPPGR
jgi:uncharacterized protein with GYD domain